jgi:hypothetical protein
LILKILCNECGQEFFDDDDDVCITDAWAPEFTPVEEEDSNILLCPRLGTLPISPQESYLMNCDNCNHLIHVANSSNWLLQQAGRLNV